MELKREKYEEITRDLLERTIALTNEMLAEAEKKGYERFDEIIMVGGATRMPQVARRIQAEFAMEPKIFDPDEAVGKGAAIYGWKLALNDNLIQRIAQKTNTDFETIDDLIENTPERVIDEVVQEVADDTGYSLSAVKRSTLKINNVASKSFGVVARDHQNREQVFNHILRNTTVPVDLEHTFYTTVKNQESVWIRVMESETNDRIVLPDNAIEIGAAVLHLPADVPVDSPINISFKLNEEGRLLITAIEATNSREVNVTIDTTSVIQGTELAEAKVRSQRLKVL